jgi:hypothetical protein
MTVTLSSAMNQLVAAESALKIASATVSAINQNINANSPLAITRSLESPIDLEIV